MNPFKYGCVVQGENFCKRPELSAQLASFIRAGQNVVIQGERRMGKTSLVRETVSHLRGVKLIYIDLFGVCDVADLCGRLAAALAEAEQSLPFYRKLGKLLSQLRPTITLDSDSGLPVFSVDTAAAGRPGSLEAALSAIAHLSKAGGQCVVFDEFQDVLKMEDGKRTLAVMRGRIQLDAATAYVFLGSVRNRMTDIFWEPSSPFYHSAAALPVGEIPEADFFLFARDKFGSGKRKISQEVFSRIFTLAHGIPGYIQELCDTIWSCSEAGEKLDEESIKRGLSTVFARELDHYQIFMERLTPIQRKVLTAIARQGGREVYSGEFITRANISGVGTMRRSLAKLAAENLLYRFEDEYRFFNPFFAQWLKEKA